MATKDELEAAISDSERSLVAKLDGVEQRLGTKIDNLAARIEGQFTQLICMMGLSISLNVAVLIRLFFVRI